MMRFHILFLTALIAASAAAEVPIVRNGTPVATIYHLEQEGAGEIAAELQHYLEAVSGPTLDRQQLPPGHLGGDPPGAAILVAYGREAIDAAGLAQMGLPVDALEPNGFLQAADGRQSLAIVALDRAGLRYGVCDLLEQIGVRWYMPTEMGEHIPHKDTITFETFQNLENPDFILRDMWLAYGGRPDEELAVYERWRRRNRMGGVEAEMGHNMGRIVRVDDYAEVHPEYFPLIDGERMIPTRRHGWQPCTSNPEVIQIATEKARAAFTEDPDLWSYSLSPNDGWGGWCQCEECVALDPPQFRDATRHGKGRRMLAFANAVAERLEETHPDRRVAFYAYAPTVEPPGDLKAHPNVAIAVAHYGSMADKFRPITDPTSPRNADYIPIVEGWAKVTDEIFAREYYTALPGPSDGLARVATAYALVEDIPWYHEHNVVGINSEAISVWGNAGLNFYMAAKMMWDVETDVEATLDDYFTGMYGPAAAPMREYFETIRDIVRERYLKTRLFTDEDFPPLRALLEEAMDLAETDKQRWRVQLSLDHFEYVTLVRRMYQMARPEDAERLAEFVQAHPDTLAFDRERHARRIKPPERTEIPADLAYEGPDVKPVSAEPAAEEAVSVSPAVRHESVWLAIPEAGETFEVSVEPRQMGSYLDPTAAELLDPTGEVVETLNVGVKDTGTIEITEADPGTWMLRMSGGRQAARATSTARTFVLVGDEHNFVGPTPRLYFLPDPDASEVSVTLESTPPGETAAITVWNASGEEVFAGHTHGTVSEVGDTLALADANRSAWSLKVDKVPEGYIEDAIVKLRGVLPYLATDPARLVVPADGG